jgi:hypothetical protein
MTVESTTKDKQITIDVPEDRVAEFYAFYGRFLAGSRRRHGHGQRRHGCRSTREAQRDHESATPAAPETTSI